jgi:elongation factor Ts
MADIDPKLVMKLRQQTGLGMMECKAALVESGGDVDKAVDNLRKKGEKTAASKAGREVKEGRIGHYIHHNGKVAAMVEVQCEDDFAARNEVFQKLGRDIAMHIVGTPVPPVAVRREEVPADLVAKEREIALGQMDADPRNAKKPAEIKQKIVDGKIDAFLRERCLLDQPFVLNPEMTVAQVVQGAIQKIGQNIVVRKFARLEVGG